MNVLNFSQGWVCLVVVFLCDVINSRPAISFRHEDVITTNAVQLDDTVYQTKLRDAKRGLEYILRDSQSIFSAMCTEFCRKNPQFSSCCHYIQVTALSYSHLSSTSLINSGSTESQLVWMVRVSGEYATKVRQMAISARGRECSDYSKHNQECPFSEHWCETHNTQDDISVHCQLVLLGSNIISFQTIARQMMTARGFQLPTVVTPTPSHDVIAGLQRDIGIQLQRDIMDLTRMRHNWEKMVDILEDLN